MDGNNILNLPKTAYEELEAFTFENTEVQDYCMDCKFETDCAILDQINKWNRHKQSKQGKPITTLEREFGCNIFKEK